VRECSPVVGFGDDSAARFRNNDSAIIIKKGKKKKRKRDYETSRGKPRRQIDAGWEIFGARASEAFIRSRSPIRLIIGIIRSIFSRAVRKESFAPQSLPSREQDAP